MFRLAAFLIAWLLAAPALAFLPGQPVGMLNPQVQPASAIAGTPAVDDNLGAGGYPIAGGICAEWGHQVPCNNHYSTVRASTKYVSASDGLYASIPAGVLGLGSNNGALIEESRTNDALWSRDMTNAAWVKTTMTTALNAVGIDGTANSATTLTATGASAMVVQTITLASQADNYSVFLKRVTGSGTINLCLDATACGTATACTVTSTTTFTSCTVTATVLNPIVGIQIVTNGDAVIADFNQMEPGGFPTSPILTTSSTATRSADTITFSGTALAVLKLISGSARVSAKLEGDTGTFSSLIVASATGNSIQALSGAGAAVAGGVSLAGNTQIIVLSRRFTVGTRDSIFYRWQVSNYAASLSGAAVVTSANATTPVAGTTYNFGSSAGAAQFASGYYDRVTLFNVPLSNGNLQSVP